MYYSMCDLPSRCCELAPLRETLGRLLAHMPQSFHLLGIEAREKKVHRSGEVLFVS